MFQGLINKLRGKTNFKVLVGDIRDTMGKVRLVPENTLEMKRWHTCSTAACVIGWHVHQTGCPAYEDLLIECSDLALQLNDYCIEDFGNVALSGSIWAKDRRYENAKYSGLFTCKELDSFKHLTEKNPTPQDAYEYLCAVYERL